MLSHIQDDDDAKAFFVKKHLMDTYSDVIEPYTNEVMKRSSQFNVKLQYNNIKIIFRKYLE